MKKVFAVLLPLTLCAAAAFANDLDDSSIGRWNSIAGVITAAGVDNPVGAIHSGAGPWSVRSGRARVNLLNGAAFFDVDGLVLNGSNSSGTPGPVTQVNGTIVCHAGTTTTVLDTAPVSLNFQAKSQASQRPVTTRFFLISIAAPAGAAGRWIATGTERFIGDEGR